MFGRWLPSAQINVCVTTTTQIMLDRASFYDMPCVEIFSLEQSCRIIFAELTEYIRHYETDRLLILTNFLYCVIRLGLAIDVDAKHFLYQAHLLIHGGTIWVATSRYYYECDGLLVC